MYKTDKWWTAPLNFLSEVRSALKLPKKVVIHDVTLRDGEQQAGVVFNKEDKTKIAKMLDEVGVHRIEAGMPAVSKEDKEAVKAIAHNGLNAEVFSFCRCMKRDVDLALECDVDGVEMEIPSSEHMMKYAYDWPHIFSHFVLTFSKRLDRKVIYHDPCFLGKQNSVYDEPRKVIESVPGVELLEFDRSRERSLCCEGGGGRMWIDIPGPSLAEIRVRDAVNSGAEILAVACPFCLLTLEDAVKTTGFEEEIKVMDIAELLALAL